RREVAVALSKVQADLARQSLGLKVYDCYRPARAVAAMARWAQQPDTAPPTKLFFPALEKRTLFAYGYIAAHSAHSTGNAVDLTLIPLSNSEPITAHSRASGNPGPAPCTAPAAQRAPDNSLDMGTGFDCFDAKSYTASAAISAGQKRARETLIAAMRKRGFHNYFREWWHFSFGTRGEAYDFAIEGRQQ
ncbi:MAG: M15 family metallopeptidase, partial [Bradyrhizobium sp.]